MNKLLELQKNIGKITKDSTNPFFKSAYFDINGLLDVLKPELNKLDLTVIQPLTNINGKMALKTIIKDGDVLLLEETVSLPENNDPQKMGSIITYFRRYALQSLFLLQAQDDDGNSASSGHEELVEKLVTNASKGIGSSIEDYQMIEDDPVAKRKINEAKKEYNRSPEAKSKIVPRVAKENDLDL